MAAYLSVAEKSSRDQDLQAYFGIMAWLIRHTLDLGDLEQAGKWSADILERAARDSERVVSGYGQVMAALALVLAGRREEGAQQLERNEARSAKTGAAKGLGFNALTRAVLREQENRWDEADAAFDEAVARFTRMELHATVAWMHWIFGRFLAGHDVSARVTQGQALLRRALAAFEQIGADRYVKEIRKRLEPV